MRERAFIGSSPRAVLRFALEYRIALRIRIAINDDGGRLRRIHIVNLHSAYNIEDLRAIAQRRLPRIAYDFLERGAEEEVTLAANRAAFERMRFMPRTLVDVSKRSQKVTLFGKAYDAPFGIAPTGAAGMYCHDADV